MTDQSPEKDTLDELIYPKITGYGLKHLEKLKIIQELTPDITQALRACVPEKREYNQYDIEQVKAENRIIDKVNANITAFIGGDSDE